MWPEGAAFAAPENGEQSVQARSAKPSTATENGTRGKRATGEAIVQSAKPPSYMSYTSYMSYRVA